MRRVLFRIHMCVGLVVAAYAVLIAITGAALVFRIDMQRALDPDLFHARVPGPTVSIERVMESVRDAYPRARLSGVDAPTAARETYLAYVATGRSFATVLVDPVSAAVLGEMPEHSALRTLQDLHFNLLAGRTGRVVNGIGAMCLLVMCITGPFIWWPVARTRRHPLVIDTRQHWRRTVWDVHGLVGACALGLLTMWSVTGLYFSFGREFRWALAQVSPITVQRPPSSTPPATDAPLVNWRSVIETARARVPEHAVARVVVPATQTSAFLVLLSDRAPTPAGAAALTSVYLDQFTGEVLQVVSPKSRTAADAVIAWIPPLHIGNFAGQRTKAVWFVFALAPPLLAVTGVVLWWTRRSGYASPSRKAKPTPRMV